MIAKLSKGGSFSGAVQYIFGLGKGADCLAGMGVLFKDTPSIIRGFERQAAQNPRVSKPVGHVVLSFSPRDAARLDNRLLLSIAVEYLDRTGIKDTQLIIVRHRDREHPHLHILFNRVGNNGRTISDRNDRHGQPACDFRRRELNGPQRFIGGIDPDRMLTIDDTGVCQILQPYGDDPLAETTTSLHDVTALSRNLLYAYSSADRQVYDLQRLLKTFRVSSSWNRGINTLASDNAGACIAVSMGVNALQEYAPELLLAEEGSTLRKLIPRRDTRFFSTCDVSPTGDRIWLSEAEASGSLLLLDRRGGLIAERPESGSRISIRHTDDGRFVAACVGDRISDPAPQIDLLTRDGDLLRRFTPKAPRSELLFKGPVTLSPDNRYLVSCDGDIVDLVDERLVYLNDRWDDLARCVDPSPLLPALRFAIHPFGHLLLGERRIVDLATGTVTETAFGGRAIGRTRTGR